MTLGRPHLLCCPHPSRFPLLSPLSSPRHLPPFVPKSSDHLLLWRKSPSAAVAFALSQFETPPSKFVSRVSVSGAEKNARHQVGDGGDEIPREPEDLGAEGEAFRKTLMLVECSMFASIAGLAYFLSNSLAIENYFSCFFSLPIVISSMRWGLSSGRKTMVATAMLLLILSGPVKASTYLLMHGFVGLTMGSLWSYVLMAIGVNTIPSMNSIYAIFGILLFLNCGFFVFLLHILYAVFLTKLGMKNSLTLPWWLVKAI